MKKYILLTAFFMAVLPLCAQEKKETRKKHTIDLDEEFFHLPDSVTDDYLDNASLPKAARINDYWIVGVHGGVSSSTATSTLPAKSISIPGCPSMVSPSRVSRR